jgi:peptidyl-prolyl cis-trans isomerase A (cyclophilin A)
MYTIFGQVVSGQDVADKISKVPTVSNDKPLVPVIVKTVTIQRKP